VEADHLQPLPLRRPREALADRRRRPPGQLGARLGLDLDLDREVEWRGVEQLFERERRLTGGFAAVVEEAAVEELLERPLVSPAREGGAEREEGAVEKDQLAVGSEAGVGLEALEGFGERVSKRGLRVVGPVGASQPVGDQVACHGGHRVTAHAPTGCEAVANHLWRSR
jgi:hypothetical protein